MCPGALAYMEINGIIVLHHRSLSNQSSYSAVDKSNDSQMNTEYTISVVAGLFDLYTKKLYIVTLSNHSYLLALSTTESQAAGDHGVVRCL